MRCVIGDGHKPVPLGTGFFYTVNRRKPVSELLLIKSWEPLAKRWDGFIYPRPSVLIEVYVPILCGMVALSSSVL